MKYSFNHFKQFLFESLLDEDKAKLIDKLVLPDLQDDPNDRLFSARSNYKYILKAFFYKYPSYENKIDWNKWKTLKKSDFDAVMELAKNSSRAKKSRTRKSTGVDPKSFFKNIGGRKFIILGEDENWLYVAPLNYAAAVFCDSKKCGGGSAKWCIGDESQSSYWNNYVCDGSKFIMAFNKNFDTMPEKELYTNLKYMIQYNGEITVWNQLDEQNVDIPESIDLEIIGDLFGSIEQEEYESEEVDHNSNAIIIPRNRLDDGIYYPPKEATGLDFWNFDQWTTSTVKGLYIPSNIKRIEAKSFLCFDELKEVKFEDNNSNIEIFPCAFAHTPLREISIPKNAILHTNIFSLCNRLRKIYIPKKYYDEDNDFELLSKTIGEIEWDNPNLQIIPI